MNDRRLSVFAFKLENKSLERVVWTAHMVRVSKIHDRRERRRLARADSGRRRQNARRVSRAAWTQTFVEHRLLVNGIACSLYLLKGEILTSDRRRMLATPVERLALRAAVREHFSEG